jgi:mannosyltransferase OCH1-like enzyme
MKLKFTTNHPIYGRTSILENIVTNVRMDFSRKPFIINNINKPKSNSNVSGTIPLNIFQTWHTLDLPPKMKENVELLKKQNPEFKHYLFDDNMCRDFIKENFTEEVVYTFDKLKPGAYKADLWRYCILYLKGGIYLDIKYKCMNGFTFIQLTDQEYWVKDRQMENECGIYQALMIHLPYNIIILKAIQSIVYIVKQNEYLKNYLSVTGPQMLSKWIQKYKAFLFFSKSGDAILYNNKEILKHYPEYRKEQSQNQKTLHYSDLWKTKDIYNYVNLQNIKTIDFTRTINKIVNGQNTLFFSGTPSLCETELGYMINIRWVNYSYNNDGSKKNIPEVWISLNSYFLLNTDFEKVTDEIFLNENIKNDVSHGIEDIRLFYFNNIIYYSGTCFDRIRRVTSACAGEYLHLSLSTSPSIMNKEDDDCTCSNKNIANTENVILLKNSNERKVEKNWSFFDFQGELRMVYHWYPVQIGKIDWNENILEIIETRNTPEYFKNARGTSPGYKKGNEIWFVLHKSQEYTNNQKDHVTFYNYQHFFAVFDLDMNLLRYSELFKLGDSKVEFCIGLIIKEKHTILSYSTMGTNSKISIYDNSYIEKMKWYFCEYDSDIKLQEITRLLKVEPNFNITS